MRTPRHPRPEQLRLFELPALGAGRVRARTRRFGTSVRATLTVVALGVATAGILAGSYAAWTAQTSNVNSAVTAGTLTMGNSKAASAVFTATDVKPGDTGSDTVTVQNTGSIPMSVRLTQDQLAGTGIESSLRLSIHDDTSNRCIHPTDSAGACATRGAWNASLANFPVVHAAGTPQWPANASHTFTLTWELLGTSPNTDQGQTGSFRLVWDGLQ